MPLSNLPGPARQAILERLSAKNLATLLRTSSIQRKNTNMICELKFKKNQKIRSLVRQNEAVVHNLQNNSFETAQNKMQNNCYKIGDVVFFRSDRDEYGIGVVSFNKNKMKKKLVSNEGLSYVSNHIPNYIKMYIEEIKYNNVESKLRNMYSLGNNVKLHVKNNILGVPFNMRVF